MTPGILVLRSRHHGEVHITMIALDRVPEDGKLRCDRCGTYLGEFVQSMEKPADVTLGRRMVIL